MIECFLYDLTLEHTQNVWVRESVPRVSVGTNHPSRFVLTGIKLLFFWKQVRWPNSLNGFLDPNLVLSRSCHRRELRVWSRKVSRRDISTRYYSSCTVMLISLTHLRSLSFRGVVSKSFSTTYSANFNELTPRWWDDNLVDINYLS